VPRLRSLIEQLMLNIMFEVPSRDDVAACSIDADVVLGHCPPHLTLRSGADLKTA